MIWNFKTHLLSSLVLSGLVYFIGKLLSKDNQTFSIGIIGGLDGPTTLFITSALFRQGKLALSCLALFIIALALYKPIKMMLE